MAFILMLLFTSVYSARVTAREDRYQPCCGFLGCTVAVFPKQICLLQMQCVENEPEVGFDSCCFTGLCLLPQED
jgi:hypothetical protein